MIVYLAQKYFINAFAFILGLAVIPIAAGVDHVYIILRAFIWGGVLGGAYTFYSFANHNLWLLFDNLRYPKYLLLVGFFLLLQILNLGIYLLF